MAPTKFNYKEILFSSESDYDDDQNSLTFAYNTFKPSVEAKTTSFDIDDEMSKAYKRNVSKIINESIRSMASTHFTTH